MPSFTTEKRHFIDLPRSCNLEEGVSYTEAEVLQTFKDTVRHDTTKSTLALKYTAWYPSAFTVSYEGNKPSAHVLTLGWDHAAVLERRDNGYYLVAVYAHGDGTEDASRVYMLWGSPGKFQKTTRHRTSMEKIGGTDWRYYDLTDQDIRMSRVVTFGITSCSFACVWPVNGAYLAVSHVAFAPPIPLFYIAKQQAVRRGGTLHGSVPRSATSVISSTLRLKMLASVNNSREELDKYTLGPRGKLPHADEFDVDAQLITRGPFNLEEEKLTVEAPFRVHPYVSLEFRPMREAVLFEGALGYNNIPGLGYGENPPFHTLGPIMRELKTLVALGTVNARTAQDMANKVKQLVNNEYGFDFLHKESIDEILETDRREVTSRGAFTYTTPWFEQALGFKSDFSDCAFLVGKERAVFRFVEATYKNAPQGKMYESTHASILRVWNRHQLGWSFPTDDLHRIAANRTAVIPYTGPISVLPTTPPVSVSQPTTSVTGGVSDL